MELSQKCLYALRAIFELAKRDGRGLTAIEHIAAAQDIPPRFLELILGQLRQGGFVASRRGPHGGYRLLHRPASLTVGSIISFVEGPLAPVECLADPDDSSCRLRGRCAFMDMWRRAQQAVASVYDTTTFQDLLEAEQAILQPDVATYCI